MRARLPATPACSRIFSRAHIGRLPSALLRTTCALSALNRCSRSFPPSSPLGEPGEESLRPTLLPADSCRTAGIEEMGLHRIRQSVVACNRRPRVETAAFLDYGLPSSWDSRFSRAPGPTGDQCWRPARKRVVMFQHGLMLRAIAPCLDFADHLLRYGPLPS